MRILKIVFLIAALFAAAVYVIVPWHSSSSGFWKAVWWEKSLYNFCKYEIPDGYKVKEYREGAPRHRDENYLIVFKNENSGQRIVLSKLKGFEAVPTNQIEIRAGKIGRSATLQWQDIVDGFRVETHLHLLPFLRQQNPAKLPKHLILKGIEVERKETYETAVVNIFLVKGTFQKIGFFKKNSFPFQFSAPVFDFITPNKGALAILTSKATGETIIAASQSDKDFNEAEFKKFIASITFEKSVYKPALLEGIEEPKPKAKYSF